MPGTDPLPVEDGCITVHRAGAW
ncbi:uncharacterized protein METZ01_LOCUS157441 [marine metagenome]|uniref:Uncharacterized protein n=1 Tax=marine metagenome TaxID=408172 RepID=A0A382AUD5_9ZZZZ